MARILLLDDSPTMHRVVRLTFADDQRMEIAVARNRNEADQSLSAQQTDLIIAYVRFDGLSDPRYFETLRFVTPRILLLAESEENLDPFLRSGFSQVLRKPFHSDELRQVVETMLESLDHSPEQLSRAPVPSSSAEAEDSFPPLDLQRFDERFESESQVTQEISLQPGEPKITLDLSFLQKSIEPESKQPAKREKFADKPSQSFAPVSQKITSPQFSEEEKTVAQNLPRFESGSSSRSAANPASAVPSTSMTIPPVPPKPPSMKTPPAPSAAPARGIEPVQFFEEPFTLENVVVTTQSAHTAPPAKSREQTFSGAVSSETASTGATARIRETVSGLSRQEVEKIVEDSVANAVSRAVRQALTETIPDLRQALVVEVSQRAVEQLSEEIIAVKHSLREQMVSELRDVSAQWLRKETPNFAKDVIREEIRRVIEQI